VTDHEEVSLAGLAAGTYYLKVHGFLGDTNPDYTLSINAPSGLAPDLFDAAASNNTRATATDLHAVTGQKVWEHLTLHRLADGSGDRDWYQFQLTTNAVSGHYACLDFDHAQGDIDFKLYDQGGNQIGSAQGVTNHEEISLAGQPAGTYYLEVYEYHGNT